METIDIISLIVLTVLAVVVIGVTAWNKRQEERFQKELLEHEFKSGDQRELFKKLKEYKEQRQKNKESGDAV